MDPDDANKRVPLLTWNTCAYSIMTTGMIKLLNLLIMIEDFNFIFYQVRQKICDRLQQGFNILLKTGEIVLNI